MLDDTRVVRESARPFDSAPDGLSQRGHLANPAQDQTGERAEPPTRLPDFLEEVAEPAGEAPAPPLPNLHPGTPPSYRLTIVGLKLVEEREKAVLVRRPYGGQAWLPKAAIYFRHPDRECRDPRIDVAMPVWLYNKVLPKLAPKRGGF